MLMCSVSYGLMAMASSGHDVLQAVEELIAGAMAQDQTNASLACSVAVSYEVYESFFNS